MSETTDSFYQRALDAAHDYVSSHEGWTLSTEPAFAQGNSHRVVRVRWADQAVVIKFYAYGNAECKENELFALTHFAATNRVPRVIDAEPERLLVVSEIPGTSLAQFADSTTGDPATRALLDIFTGLGEAFVQIGRVSFPQAASAKAELESRLRAFLDASWRVYEQEPTYHTPFFHRSLTLQEAHLNAILSQPLLLINNDLNPGNIIVHNNRFQGFVDLESCRSGTETMQLGVVLFTAAAYTLCEAAPRALWRAFLHGYEGANGYSLDHAMLQSCLAMAHFKYWAFIHRDGAYGTWEAGRPGWFVLPDAVQVKHVLAACEALVEEAPPRPVNQLPALSQTPRLSQWH